MNGREPGRETHRETSFRFVAVLGALCGQVFTGCGEHATVDTAPIDIRGTPIAEAIARPATTNALAPDPGPKPETGPTPANFDLLGGYAIEISDELLGPVTNELAAVTEKVNHLIPEPIRGLHEKSVSIKGFMLPLKVEGGLVTELLVMKDQSMCCYGSTPKINEWVSVRMKGRGVRPLMDQPVTLFGTLHVGEMRENGYLTGIYRLEGERMEAPEE